MYYARFSAGGRMVRTKLPSDYTVACQLLNDLKARADRADFDLLENDFPIDEIREQWLRHCDQTLRPSPASRYRENLSRALAGLTATKVAQVSIGAITMFRQDRLDGGASPRAVNMDVGALRRMLDWAVTHRLIGSNPLEGVSPLPEDDKRKVRRALTVEEVEAIFEHSPDDLKPV